MGHKRGPVDEDSMDLSPAAKRRLCSRGPDQGAGPRPCDVCLEPAAEDAGGVRLGACGHQMCGSCAAAWCAAAAPRRLAAGHPLRCALPACGRPVPPQQAQRLLEAAGVCIDNTAAGAAMEAAAAGLLPEGAAFTCPYPDCGVVSELEAALPDAPSACPSCGRGVCPCCRCMWHSGLRCSQYQEMGAGGGGGSAADKRCRILWRRSGGRQQQQQQQQLFTFHQQGLGPAPAAQPQQPFFLPFGAHQQQHAQPPASPMSP